MIGVELVQELVRSVLLTGRVQGLDPVSLLLIAHPESGKTSIVTSSQVESAIVLTDVTGRGLLNLCQMNPRISHFIVNDLTVVTSHKPTVSKYTFGVLTAMTEEGIASVVTPAGLTKYECGKRGLIACCTISLAMDGRAWWNRMGFSTRFVPFCFSHSKTLTVRIKASIIKGAELKKKPVREFIIPHDYVQIGISSMMRSAVALEAEKVCLILRDSTDELGYRRLKQWLGIAQGHALLRGEKSVGKRDVDFLIRIRPFISYNEAKEL